MEMLIGALTDEKLKWVTKLKLSSGLWRCRWYMGTNCLHLQDKLQKPVCMSRKWLTVLNPWKDRDVHSAFITINYKHIYDLMSPQRDTPEECNLHKHIC